MGRFIAMDFWVTLLRLALASIVVIAVSGCDDVDRPDPPPDDGPTDASVVLWPDGAVEVGTDGEMPGHFVSLPAYLPLSPGAQGGFHVPIAYKVIGQSAAEARFEHRVRLATDGGLLSRGSRGLSVRLDGGVWVSEEPISVFICPTPLGVDAVNQRVRFEVTVFAPDGGVFGRATREATLECPSGNSFCQSICKG